MKSVFVFIAAILMAGCAKLEFEELADYPDVHVTDSAWNVTNAGGEGWKIILSR